MTGLGLEREYRTRLMGASSPVGSMFVPTEMIDPHLADWCESR